MELKSDEMGILKGTAVKLDDNTILLVTMQYHTERDPQTGKVDRSKSRYRWLARVDTTANFQTMAAEMKQDANRLNPWRWPDDPSWTGSIVYTDSGNLIGSRWYTMKLKKAVDWDTGLKIFNGFKPALEAKGQDPYNAKAKYDVDGYTLPDGTTISLTDKEALLAHVGQNLVKEQTMKSKTPM